MTNRKALIALRDDVVAGKWGPETRALRSPPSTFKTPFAPEPMDKRRCKAWSAYHGSVDAAIALLEAVLPKLGWTLADNGRAVIWSKTTPPKILFEASAVTPARALLIATLKALIAETKQ